MQNYQNRVPEQIWKDSSRYQDIMGLSRPVSVNHPPMDRISRAAQFAPFAALTGHNDVIRETARITDQRPLLSEDEQDMIQRQLTALEQHLPEKHPAEFCYFVPAPGKQGGALCTASGLVKRIDSVSRIVLLEDGTRICIDEILSIEC